MPPVLACQNHPLNKGKPLVSNTFVMLVKTDLKSMKAAYKYERSMDAPAGTQREWLKMGESVY
jgi:hypothetical protein